MNGEIIMGKKTERKIYESHIINEFSGEIIESKQIYTTAEPEYVKLYLDCILLFKGLPKGLNPIIIEFLRHMSYADVNGYGGGQIIFVNKALKQCIADRLGVTIKRIEQAITQFVKSGIFKRVAVGTYQVNANIFGKGEWKDIKNIRATFNYGTGEIVADIVKEEEEKINKATDKIEKESNTKLANAAVNTAAYPEADKR